MPSTTPVKQIEVHPADEGAVLLGEGVEGAVGQHDVAAAHVRFEPVVLEDPEQRLPPLPLAGLATDGGERLLADLPAGRHCRVPDRPIDAHALDRGAFHRLGEQPARQVVAPPREREFDGGVRPPVHLRRAARARARPSAEPFEPHRGQAGVDQLVEVEGGDGPGHAERLGRLVPADLVPLDEEAVRRLGDRVIESGDAVHLLLERPSHAQPHSKTRTS